MTLGKVTTNVGIYELACLHAYDSEETDPIYVLKDSQGYPHPPPKPFGWIGLSVGTIAPTITDTAPDTEIVVPDMSSVYTRKKCTRKIIVADIESPYTVYVQYEATFEPGEIVAEADPNDGSITINGIFLSNDPESGKPYYIEVRNPMTFDATTGAIIRIRCAFAQPLIEEQS